MGRPLKCTKANNVDTGITSMFVDGPKLGVIGGIGTLDGSQLIIKANIEYTPGSYASGDAFIVRQKGSKKFLVANVANTARQGICYIVTSSTVTNLNAGEMRVVTSDTAPSDVVLREFSNKYGVSDVGLGYWLTKPGFGTATANNLSGSLNDGLYTVVSAKTVS